MDEIKLRKHGEEKPLELPRGVRLLVLGERAMFVKMHLGKIVPLPDKEQLRLMELYCDNPADC